jgi:hypothetical protein
MSSIPVKKTESFKQYSKKNVICEASNISATEWEKIIEIAYNKVTSQQAIKDPKLTEPYRKYLTVKSAADGIVKSLRDIKGVGGKIVIQYGSGRALTSPMWKGKDTDAPKTDIYFTNKSDTTGNYTKSNNVRISLKKAGGSQLMSAEKQETINTFVAAEKHMHRRKSKTVSSLIKEIEKGFTSIVTDIPLNDLKGLYDKQTGKVKKKGIINVSGRDIKITKDILAQRDAILQQEKVHNSISAHIKSYFEKNVEFKNCFVYEAASGELKFETFPLAFANWIVTFDPDKSSAKAEKISSDASTYTPVIEKYAKNIKMYVAFKSGHTFDAARYSTLRAGVPARVEHFYAGPSYVSEKNDIREVVHYQNIWEMMDEAWIKFYTNDLIQESFLTEAQFINRVKSFLKTLFEQIKDVLYKLSNYGLTVIREFLGIEIEDVTVVDNVVFSV